MRLFKNLLDPRLGTLSGGISWSDDQANYSAPIDQGRRILVKDYNLSLSILPLSNPLTLFAQKTDRADQFNITTNDTITTYGFGWIFSPGFLPRVGINGVHNEYTSDLSGLFPTRQTDYLTIDTGGRWHNYNISARYLYNQTRGANGDSFWAHGVNLNLNGALTQTLTLGAYANYASRGGTASGFGYSQENALGLNLYYLPNKYWDGNLRFDFNESPGSVDFKRYMVGSALNLHPTYQLDILFPLQYSRFDTGYSRTDSIFINPGLNYRPFFGLTLTGGVGAGITHLSGGGISSTNDFEQANWSATYFKILRFIRVNTGYAGNIAQNYSNALGRSSDLTNTISAGVDNTQTEYIHVGVNGSWTQVHRTVPTESNDQKETRLSATADSRFFRDLLFYADSLILDGTLTYQDISGFGVEGRTLSEVFDATYQFLGIFSLLANYSHFDYPTGFYGNSVNIESIDFLGTLRPWYNGLLTFSLKELVNEGQTINKQTTFDGQTRLSHQIGLLTISAEYNYLRNDVGTVTTIGQQFLVRAIRPF